MCTGGRSSRRGWGWCRRERSMSCLVRSRGSYSLHRVPSSPSDTTYRGRLTPNNFHFSVWFLWFPLVLFVPLGFSWSLLVSLPLGSLVYFGFFWSLWSLLVSVGPFWSLFVCWSLSVSVGPFWFSWSLLVSVGPFLFRFLLVPLRSCSLFLVRLGSLLFLYPIHLSLSQSLSEFHSDLFPDTAGGEPALTATQWCSGDNTKVGKNLVTEGAKKTKS